MIKKVVGIDCSSTTIGIAVLEVDDIKNTIKYISCDYIKPIKDGNIVERLVNTRDKLAKLINNIKPDYIAIEEIISFMKGKSTATTIITLTAFNRMACLLCYDYLKKSPELLNVMSIRHGIKLNKIFPKKEQIPDLVANHLNITFPYETNKKGKIKAESYDKADAVAVALYYAFLLTGKIKKKK
jgi:Holliday junction resolvasome RuvABC endonuclease subunit